MHIQVHPNTLVVTGNDGILPCLDGCILGNQTIGINTIPTALAGLGMIHIVFTGIVGRIGRTGYGHIMLGVDLKGPRRNGITLLVLQAVHGQFKGADIKAGRENQLGRFYFPSCTLKSQRLETAHGSTGPLNSFRIVWVENFKPSDHLLGSNCGFIGRCHWDHPQNHHQCQQNHEDVFGVLFHKRTS